MLLTALAVLIQILFLPTRMKEPRPTIQESMALSSQRGLIFHWVMKITDGLLIGGIPIR